jgi:hypothetical protein
MKIEYLTDEHGHQKAVVIPIADWKAFFSEYNTMKNKLKGESKKISKPKKIVTGELPELWKDD